MCFFLPLFPTDNSQTPKIWTFIASELVEIRRYCAITSYALEPMNSGERWIGCNSFPKWFNLFWNNLFLDSQLSFSYGWMQAKRNNGNIQSLFFLLTHQTGLVITESDSYTWTCHKIQSSFIAWWKVRLCLHMKCASSFDSCFRSNWTNAFSWWDHYFLLLFSGKC